MEENNKGMATKKAVYVSAAIIAPFMLIFYGREILEIGLVGGTAFGLLFLLMMHHKSLLGQMQKCLTWLFSCTKHQENEE